MTTPMFRARFRFRVAKKLNVAEHERRFTVSDREVVLSAQADGAMINATEWLVMNARGFATEQEARDFAHRLRAAVDMSSVATRLGIDSGVDRFSSDVGQLVRERVERDHGTIIRGNVHGVDVFPDLPNIRIFSLSAVGTVRKDVEPFLSDVSTFFAPVTHLSERGKDVVLLLNYALMRTDPVSQIVFAISAVEMLGQDEAWSTGQKQLIADLAAYAEVAECATPDERQEVAEALRKGLHKISLRQGVMRLLKSVGLNDLRKAWDEIYGQRSTLVHGLAPRPGADYSQLAFRTMSLCGRILLKVIATEGVVADRHVEKFYEHTPPA